MNLQYFWMSIIPLGIGTFLIRSCAIYLSNKIMITDRVKEIFSFIPAAILPALVAPMVFYYKGTNDLFFHKERLFALLIALYFTIKFKNIFISILSGLLALYLFSLI